MVKISLELLEEAMEQDDNIGFCLWCGLEAWGVEPDARNYDCEECGESMVYGAEEIFLMGEFEEEE